MKINEILIESQLQEGPLLNKLGSAVGKGIGTLAKGVGAVAGGIAGIGSAVKKGYQAGKAQVGAAGDDAPSSAAGSATTATGSAPAAKPAQTGTGGSAKPGTQTLANPKDPNAGTTPAAPKTAPQGGSVGGGAAGQDGAAGAAGQDGAAGAAGAAGQPGKSGAAGQPGKSGAAGAAGKPDAVGPADSQGRIEPKIGSAAPANDTQYAQAQKAIAALQPEDQKQVLAALQSDPKVKAAMTQPAAAAAGNKTTSTKDNPNAPKFTGVPEKPSDKTTPQPIAQPTASPEQKPQAAGKKPASPKKKVAPSQAEIDADRERLIGPTSDSIIRTGRSIVEHIDEAGLMAKLGTKVGQAAQATGAAAGKAVGTVQQAVADPEHSKALVKAFAKGDTSADPDSAPTIQDSSGTVPRPIIDKINQLNLEQRAELHKLITQKTL